MFLGGGIGEGSPLPLSGIQMLKLWFGGVDFWVALALWGEVYMRYGIVSGNNNHDFYPRVKELGNRVQSISVLRTCYSTRMTDLSVPSQLRSCSLNIRNRQRAVLSH
jgi:hypothetical protein